MMWLHQASKDPSACREKMVNYKCVPKCDLISFGNGLDTSLWHNTLDTGQCTLYTKSKIFSITIFQTKLTCVTLSALKLEIRKERDFFWTSAQTPFHELISALKLPSRPIPACNKQVRSAELKTKFRWKKEKKCLVIDWSNLDLEQSQDGRIGCLVCILRHQSQGCGTLFKILKESIVQQNKRN